MLKKDGQESVSPHPSGLHCSVLAHSQERNPISLSTQGLQSTPPSKDPGTPQYRAAITLREFGVVWRTW